MLSSPTVFAPQGPDLAHNGAPSGNIVNYIHDHPEA